MALSFGDNLAARIKAKEWTMREFSRRAGSNVALVSRVIRGQRSPPLGSLEAWADAFGLAGSDRSDFIEQGRLAVCPLEIVALVKRLRRENAELKAKS